MEDGFLMVKVKNMKLKNRDDDDNKKLRWEFVYFFYIHFEEMLDT